MPTPPRDPMGRFRDYWQRAWDEGGKTAEKRRLNEGLSDLWQNSESSSKDRDRLVSDIVGNPM